MPYVPPEDQWQKSWDETRKARRVVSADYENDYDYVEIDLGTARVDAALGLSGTSLVVKDLTGTASIRFNSVAKPLVPLAKGEVYRIKFTEIYLTNTAQAGQSLKLFIGKVS